MDESIFEIGRKTQAKGKPRINPIPDKTAPTKSTKNPYQKQTEGLKRANVSKANYAAYNENPTAMASEINIQNYPQTRREKVENEGREGAKRKGKERREGGRGKREGAQGWEEGREQQRSKKWIWKESNRRRRGKGKPGVRWKEGTRHNSSRWSEVSS